MRRGAARRTAGLLAAVLAVVLVSGALTSCQRQISGPVLVLRLATPDTSSDSTASVQVQHFAAEVSARSHGTIEIEPVWDADRGALGWDQLVARGVADGRWQLGLVPGRAWDALGVDSLRALSTPFLVTSPAALEAVLDSGVREDLLAGLPKAGVVGLDLFPDAMRHPFGYEEPLLGVEDYQGAEIRTADSATVTALFDALGASVTDAPPDSAAQRGAESQYSITQAGIATGNVTFFAKTDALVADQDVRARLRPDQWALLSDAAAATRSWLFAEQPSDFEAAARFCADGGKIVAATPDQVAGIEAAAAPVIAQLRKDADTAALIDRIRGLIKGLPAPTPVTECPGATATATSTGQPDDTEVGLLDGVYTTRVTAKMMRDAGETNAQVIRENTGRFTWTIDHGRWTYHQTADHYINNPDDTGRYTYKRGLFTFYWPEAGDSTTALLHVARDGTIAFTDVKDVVPANQAGSVAFFHQPWVRIGGTPG